MHAERLRLLRHVGHVGAGLTLALGLACADPTGVRLADVVGTWRLVQLRQTLASTGEETDAMQVDSTSSFTMTVAPDGKITALSKFGSAPLDTVSGSIVISGGRAALTLDDATFVGAISISGSFLTLDCGPSSAVSEYSRIVFVFARSQ